MLTYGVSSNHLSISYVHILIDDVVLTLHAKVHLNQGFESPSFTVKAEWLFNHEVVTSVVEQ